MIAKQKILIVDDDENIAELISLYLMKECFDTKIVSNGEDALSAFETCSLQKEKYLTKYWDWSWGQMTIS